MPTLTTIIQHSFGNLGKVIREEKGIKGIQNGKEVKLSLFADDMILYIENPKYTVRKLLELISEFSKFGEYKSTHRNHLHSCTLTMKNQKEKSIPFTIATERIKYLGINLPKETKELYTENYKTRMKEIKEDISKWRDMPYS